jgi:hypothetical protein
MNDIQLVILDKMKTSKTDLDDFVKLLTQDNPEINKNQLDWTFPVNISGINVFINRDEVDFYVSELISLGLIAVTIKPDWASDLADKYYTLTNTARKFLEYIEL